MENLNGIIAAAASFILGIGVVWTFLAKFTPIAKKYVGIAKESLDLLNSVLVAIEDKTVTKEEIERIRLEANELIEALK